MFVIVKRTRCTYDIITIIDGRDGRPRPLYRADSNVACCIVSRGRAGVMLCGCIVAHATWSERGKILLTVYGDLVRLSGGGEGRRPLLRGRLLSAVGAFGNQLLTRRIFEEREGD